ncbi:nucleotidyltransferase [Fulvimarina endophytica]|uniref:Cyclic GMP-AMP synthase n=1 Tax=Fulvimarina endophytica TaxID=2293836 RepID=A0A371X0J5_9HYPH|nr:nucleotidyltransferase [Fulvimarina endophytica]RFC62726.1 nucleotidyltransferase [Fulvimarina endophytica]
MNAIIGIITPEAERFLEAMAQELEIPRSRYEHADSRFHSLGDWFGRPESTIRHYDPQIYVQGSFRLGTAIRPWTEAEDYDVDSVCVLRLLDKGSLTQEQLKWLVGYEIELYAKAHGMAKPVREGRRCWVLEYADGAQFHMDIVPAVPDEADQRALLQRHMLDAAVAKTAISITDREDKGYRIFTRDWPRSNPKAYSEWFRAKVVAVEVKRRKDGIRAEVENMPTFRIRTPLQSAVMILKRHRDRMFAKRPDERPISVIITTLAAHAYGGELTIGKALVSILSRMDQFIETVNGVDYIKNPTDPLENFADKWGKHPERRAAFHEWLRQARADFYNAAVMTAKQDMAKAVQDGVGVGLAEKARARAVGIGAPAFLSGTTIGSAAAASTRSIRAAGGGRNA